jgi:DNA-binding MarR family transcriptional regulator
MTATVDSRRDTMMALEAQIWFLLKRIRQHSQSLAAEIAPELGLNGYGVLAAIDQRGPLRQGDIAELVGLDKSAMSRLAGELVELGLVVRIPDPSDARAHRLDLSDAGRTTMAGIRSRRREQFAVHLTDWTEAELQRLTDDLVRYNSALNA